MELINEFRNNLLKRTELRVEIRAESNPGFENARKIISEKFNSSDDRTVINNVLSKFGSKDFLIDAFIYDSVEDRKKILHRKEIREIKKEIKKK